MVLSIFVLYSFENAARSISWIKINSRLKNYLPLAIWKLSNTFFFHGGISTFWHFVRPFVFRPGWKCKIEMVKVWRWLWVFVLCDRDSWESHLKEDRQFYFIHRNHEIGSFSFPHACNMNEYKLRIIYSKEFSASERTPAERKNDSRSQWNK